MLTDYAGAATKKLWPREASTIHHFLVLYPSETVVVVEKDYLATPPFASIRVRDVLGTW